MAELQTGVPISAASVPQQAPAERGAPRIDSAGLVEFTRQLVRTRSVHDPAAGSTELAAAMLVVDKMREFGWEPMIEEVAPGRPNVVAILDGGGGRGPSLAFEGHTDVVTEGDPADWSEDPYSGVITGGILHGRGSADMKSGLAAAIYAARAVQLAGPFPGRILVCVLADEEGMMLGAKHLARSGLLSGVAGAIICEPEGGEICTVSKGAIRVQVTIHGAMAHGAMPHQGRNPVTAAGRLLAGFQELQDSLRAEHSMTDGIGGLSITPTVVQAGSVPQINVIPATATVGIDVRTTPEIDHEQLLARIREVTATVAAAGKVEAGVEVLDDRPAVAVSASHPVVAALAVAHRQVHGSAAPLGIVPGTTDGTILTRDAGLPTVVYGPGGKWIAHQANEFVEVAEIERYAQVYARAAEIFLFGQPEEEQPEAVQPEAGQR